MAKAPRRFFSDEAVAFSWGECPDKAIRDAGMTKMMEDPSMDPSTPGNGKAMIFGGSNRWSQ